MKELLGENWLTTLGGIIAATGLALLGAPQIPADYKWIAAIIAAIGVGITGGAAKSYNVHSTQAEVKASTEVKKEATAEEIKALEAELKAKK